MKSELNKEQIMKHATDWAGRGRTAANALRDNSVARAYYEKGDSAYIDYIEDHIPQEAEADWREWATAFNDRLNELGIFRE